MYLGLEDATRLRAPVFIITALSVAYFVDLR